MSRLDNLKNYVTRLQAADKDDAPLFHRLVVEGFALVGLTDAIVAREMDMSRPSVSRWRTGRNAPPHAAMRPIVYRKLVRLAKAQIEACS